MLTFITLFIIQFADEPYISGVKIGGKTLAWNMLLMIVIPLVLTIITTIKITTYHRPMTEQEKATINQQ